MNDTPPLGACSSGPTSQIIGVADAPTQPRRWRETIYRGIPFRSRAEAEAAQWLDVNGVPWTYTGGDINTYPHLDSVRFISSQGRSYTPDFVIHGKDYVEVKVDGDHLDPTVAAGFHNIWESHPDARCILLVGTFQRHRQWGTPGYSFNHETYVKSTPTPTWTPPPNCAECGLPEWGNQAHPSCQPHPCPNCEDVTVIGSGVCGGCSDRSEWLTELHHMASACIHAKHDGQAPQSAYRRGHRYINDELGVVSGQRHTQATLEVVQGLWMDFYDRCLDRGVDVESLFADRKAKWRRPTARQVTK